MSAERARRKAEDVDLAARAIFEVAKCSIDKLEGVEWESLPDTRGPLHPMLGKEHYRREARLAVEALWRAGRLTVPGIEVPPDSVRDRYADQPSTE
jgi:hypothetical protein